MSGQECRWEDGVRLTARHDRHCETAGCAGCVPCERDHCRCGRHLRDSEPLTCAHCVGQARDDLKRIDELCRLASTAAAEKGGVDSAAMVLAGPIAEHSTHAARRTYAYKGGLCRCGEDCPDLRPMPEGPVCEKVDDRDKPCRHYACRRVAYRPTCPGLVDWLEYADDERHPLWVLGSWDMLVTEHLEHDRTNRVTVSTAASYLAANLTYLGQDRDFAFDELAREVKSCREHVETVMGVAEWVQRGAPCPTCKRRMECKRGATEAGDRWSCPTKDCGPILTQGEYDERVYRDYLEKAPRLTAAQMLAQYRIPEGSLRRWANGWTHPDTGEWCKPTVDKHGKDAGGRLLYDVAQAVAMRDRPPSNRVA